MIWLDNATKNVTPSRGEGVGHAIFNLHWGVGHSVLCQREGAGHVFSNHHILKCSVNKVHTFLNQAGFFYDVYFCNVNYLRGRGTPHYRRMARLVSGFTVVM